FKATRTRRGSSIVKRPLSCPCGRRAAGERENSRSFRSAAAATAATAAAATAILAHFGQFLIGRHAPELKRHAHVAANFLLERFQFALGTDEIPRNRVLEECLARRLELADLGFAKLNAGALLLVELFAALVNALVLELRSVVAEKFLNGLLEFDKPRIGRNFGAEFLGLG